MNKIDCNIIRDLLPLYEDDVASQETQELVRTHLADCLPCREVLRKMRTPISLPPAGDEEAVKRYLEYQEKVRRKQYRKIICFVSIAAALIAAISLTLLWYTRPRGWESISDSGEVTQLSAALHKTMGNGFETYTQTEEEGLEAPGEQILALLEEATYRIRPWDTLTYRHSNGYGETGVSGTITVFLSWDEGQQAEFFTIYSSGTVCKGNTVYTSKLDGANLYKAIAAIIQEYGVQSG